jgi:trehalose-phosphatase
VTSGHDTAALPADLAAALQGVACADRLLVATDFDGTLAPIVGDPAAAAAAPGALAVLRALDELPRTTVAVVSGRSRETLASLAPLPPTVHLIGSHGAETDLPLELDAAEQDLLAQVRAELHAITDSADGALLEPKPAGAAVHVRRAARPDAARVTAAVLAGPATRDGIHVTTGKEVVELSVRETSKGLALDALRAATGSTAVVFLGDDTTDETVFVRLTPADVGIKVGAGPTAAPHRVADPTTVVAVLESLLSQRKACVTRGADQ